MVAPPFQSEYWEGCNVNKLKYGENHEITAFCSQNKRRGLKCYIYTLPTAAAMHNRHFLGHNQSRSLRKILARLLIITSSRKVSVLGLVTKSMLKIFIWQQLGELGRAAVQSPGKVRVWPSPRDERWGWGREQGWVFPKPLLQRLTRFILQMIKVSRD